MFGAWRKQVRRLGESRRIKIDVREVRPDDLLENPTMSVLNKWLPAFVVKARREGGKRYPAAAINQLLAGLWRAARIICLGMPTRVIWLISHR